MCGIAGVVEAEGAPDRDRLTRMGEAIRHRGPDDGQVRVFGKAGFSFRRLSIIDVAGGAQPISNETGRIHVMGNGEIYNYLDLRRDLEALGHRFRTNSDVETIVHGYEQWGDDVPSKLRGMFAFAIWDEDRQRLLLGRDRLGKKPLLYSEVDGRLAFGSEFAALLADTRIPREIDREAIDDFLTLLYVPFPRSGFKAIRKLPPAHTLAFENGVATVRRYWKPETKPRLRISFDEAVEEAERRIREAVKMRLMSEVPLGAFLSGGIDSSLVVSFMSEFTKVRTFSIGFTVDEYNELPYARQVAERYGCDHREFVVKPDAMEVLPTLVRHYGEPYADSSALPTYYLAKMTREHVTVALNGDGGDEFFAGYDRYRALRYFQWMSRARALGPLARAAARLPGVPGRARRALAQWGRDPREGVARMQTAFATDQKRSLYSAGAREEFGGREALDFVYAALDESGQALGVRAFQYAEAMTYLPGDLLPKVDIATMTHSLEGRSPLLDQELVEWALRLPDEHVSDPWTGKLILRAIARKRLPAAVIDRPKRGFGVPIDHWFREELYGSTRDLLLSPSARERGFFDPAKVEGLIEDHRAGRAAHGFRLWTLLCLEMWFREVACQR